MSLSLVDDQRNELLFLGFNQDQGCFACGTDSGFRVYNCDPFKETFRRDFGSGGIAIVEMLFRCNIMALVGGGKTPLYPRTKVMIWDDHDNRCIGELTFRSEVRAVRLRKDRVVVVVNNKVYVYNFTDLRLMDHIETVRNPLGLCAINPDPARTVLACPGLQRGTVRVERYDESNTVMVTAHESELAAIALNTTGSRLATASHTGTLVRVFDASTGVTLHALRRGVDKTVIRCLTFDPLARHLACSSDKGTIHVFKLGQGEGASGAGAGAAENDGDEAGGNRRARFAFLGVVHDYFSSEWSYAQYRGPDARSMVAFGKKPNTLIVVGADGTCAEVSFARGGEAQRVGLHRFLDEGEDPDAGDRA